MSARPCSGNNSSLAHILNSARDVSRLVQHMSIRVLLTSTVTPQLLKSLLKMTNANARMQAISNNNTRLTGLETTNPSLH